MEHRVLHFRMDRLESEGRSGFIMTGIEIPLVVQGEAHYETYRAAKDALADMLGVDVFALPLIEIEYVGSYVQCPCCDYFTLIERGMYDICDVCFWEDDGMDVDELDEDSGPNHMTLRQARANFKKYGACDEASTPHVISAEKRGKYEYSPRDIG